MDDVNTAHTRIPMARTSYKKSHRNPPYKTIIIGGVLFGALLIGESISSNRNNQNTPPTPSPTPVTISIEHEPNPESKTRTTPKIEGTHDQSPDGFLLNGNNRTTEIAQDATTHPPDTQNTQPSDRYTDPDTTQEHNDSPEYPEESLRLHETGNVVLELAINAHGNVIGGRINASSGSDRLDAAALNQAQHWHFTQGPSVFLYTVRFSLPN